MSPIPITQLLHDHPNETFHLHEEWKQSVENAEKWIDTIKLEIEDT